MEKKKKKKRTAGRRKKKTHTLFLLPSPPPPVCICTCVRSAYVCMHTVCNIQIQIKYVWYMSYVCYFLSCVYLFYSIKAPVCNYTSGSSTTWKRPCWEWGSKSTLSLAGAFKWVQPFVPIFVLFFIVVNMCKMSCQLSLLNWTEIEWTDPSQVAAKSGVVDLIRGH